MRHTGVSEGGDHHRIDTASTRRSDSFSLTAAYRRIMAGDAVFVWIFLGLAFAVLVAIALYVNAQRRKRI